jgi:xanthine dehydrogenase accessory factor
MGDCFDFLDEIRKTGRQAALATLVATRGTSPRKEGARMWVDETGRILGSVTIGGCVDAEVIRAAEGVLGHGEARLLTIELGDEDAHALGLTCAGTIDVLVEAVGAGTPEDEATNLLRQHVRAGGRAVRVTRLPAGAGSVDLGGPRFVVFDDGRVVGTMGGTGLDSEAVEHARQRLRLGGSRTHTLVSGNQPLDAFFEVFGPGTLLAIVGAGTIAEALSHVGRLLGMRVVIIDGRARFATKERFPDAEEIRVGMPSEEVTALPHGPDSAIVVVSHDYKFDVPVLKAALETPAGYIGMLGSRRRGGAILDMLEAEGVSRDAIARIHTPIGLDIGAQTAAEIAVAIAAEIVATRTGSAGGRMGSRSRTP